MKVLVVDDDRHIRDAFKRMLEIKHYGHKIVATGDEAVREIKKERFDIVFLDIVMPGMDGVETLKAIKEIVPGIPVVLMTGYSVEEKIYDAIQFNDVEYLFKPFDITEIFYLLDKVIKGGIFGVYPRWFTVEDIIKSRLSAKKAKRQVVRLTDEANLERVKNKLIKSFKECLKENMLGLMFFDSTSIVKRDTKINLDIFLVAEKLPEHPVKREAIIMRGVPYGFRNKSSVIAKTKEEFERDFSVYYLDLAMNGTILCDSGDYLKRKLAIIKNIIKRKNLTRKEELEGFDWEWNGKPSKFWEVNWNGVHRIEE